MVNLPYSGSIRHGFLFMLLLLLLLLLLSRQACQLTKYQSI